VNPAPPHFSEAERAVLAAMLLDPVAVARVVESLQPDDFYNETHRVVFRAMIAIHGKGLPVDWLTLTKTLRESGCLEQVGGIDFLTGLSDAVPSAANVGHYIKIVKEKADLRRIVNACESTLKAARSPGVSIQEIFGEHYSAMFDISRSISQTEQKKGPVPVCQIVSECFTDVCERTETGRPFGIRSGFHRLDEYTGGFQRTDLIVICGRPGMGKSAFAFDVATTVSRTGVSFIFSLEMGKDQIGHRHLAREGRTNLLRIRNGEISQAEMDRLVDVVGAAEDLGLWVDVSSGISPMYVRLKAEELQIRQKVKIDLLVVDYLQLMKSSTKIEKREQEVSSISRDLKAIAKDLNVPVIALCQLNRKVEERTNKRPQLADLRESGAIEQDADVVMGLYYPHHYDQTQDVNEAEVIIMKQRNGPVGTIPLRWIPQWTTFQNREG